MIVNGAKQEGTGLEARGDRSWSKRGQVLEQEGTGLAKSYFYVFVQDPIAWFHKRQKGYQKHLPRPA